MAEFSGAELERMLTEARETLESMRQGGTAPRPARTAEAADGDALQGVGEAAGGAVRVVAEAAGRVKSVHLDEKAMRLSPRELGEQLVTAVNAALEDLRVKAATAAAARREAEPGEQSADLQDQSLRQMELLTQAINDTLAKIGGNR
ncbi:YbaB/EbfC family nucleoid-associated protein [Actinomadura keratinilytica]|uniref:YbaB/EbfC family DNA-binding protein n=1 Tax=Actinomadura keratinilytica TaxID=547461 RepID=A0ABP7Y3F8_9ACTN